MNSFLQIKKISDLTRLCILPVMVLSIFLSFFLYVDMGKIQDKAQDLVDGAIPHISAAQQGAISLVQLRRNIETLTTSVDQQRCRLAFFQATAVLKDNILFNTSSLQFKRDELLVEVNRLWKQRILIDQLRSNVHNSLHYMDMLAFLIASEQPELFHDIDLKQGDYVDLYRTGIYNRDLRAIHHYYYTIFSERLSPKFNRKEFLETHPLPQANNNANTIAMLDSQDAEQAEQIIQNQINMKAQGKVSEVNNRNEPAFVQSVADNLAGAKIAQEQSKAQQEAKNIIASKQNPQNTNKFNSLLYSSQSYADIKDVKNEELDDDWLERLLKEHKAKASHKHARYFSKSTDPEILKIAAVCHNALLLDYYAQELERFDPIWDIYLKQQREYAGDIMSIVRKLEDLADDFTYSELHSLHQELSDITYLASETKPMVMGTIAFGLIGFWVVIYFLNRLIMQPLRIIARILIKFRYTKEVNLERYDEFFKKQHLVEIREVIDVLPQIFEEFSHITESSNVLKKRYDELVTHSKYDALTRVFNRGSLNVLINELDTNTPSNFAILMIDIDFFKLLNDSMGHQRGDEVLFAVAQTIQHNLAKKDLVYRYGGEEFCVILSDVNYENAFRVADRLCRTIESLQLKNDGVVSGVVTISIGLSLVTQHANQFRIEELINQADKALYEAKRSGRNRVHACDEKLALETQGIAPVPVAAPAAFEEEPNNSEAKLNQVLDSLGEQESIEELVLDTDTDDLNSIERQALSEVEGSFPITSFSATLSTNLSNSNNKNNSSEAEHKDDTIVQPKMEHMSWWARLKSVVESSYEESDEEYFVRQQRELREFKTMPAYFYFLFNDKCLRELREEELAKLTRSSKNKKLKHTESKKYYAVETEESSSLMIGGANSYFELKKKVQPKDDKDIKLSQDGMAYEFSLTASDLAQEEELKKELNDKINEVLADNDPPELEIKPQDIVVGKDGFVELSIGAHNTKNNHNKGRSKRSHRRH